MLGLERAAELDSHQLRHFAHEGLVTGDLGRIIEALGEDEVQVALQRVAEEDRLVVAVLVEQLDQPIDAFGQALDRKVTSSMITVVPVWRTAPTAGKVSRIFHSWL